METKKGFDWEACTLPEKPALHLQPATTLTPLLLVVGQEIFVQVDVKYGGTDSEVTPPLNPELQVHPDRTSIP